MMSNDAATSSASTLTTARQRQMSVRGTQPARRSSSSRIRPPPVPSISFRQQQQQSDTILLNSSSSTITKLVGGSVAVLRVFLYTTGVSLLLISLSIHCTFLFVEQQQQDINRATVLASPNSMFQKNPQKNAKHAVVGGRRAADQPSERHVTTTSTTTATTAEEIVANAPIKATSRFAYAYVVGGVDPTISDDALERGGGDPHPSSSHSGSGHAYRHFLQTVLINTATLREAGSTSNVIVYLQMPIPPQPNNDHVLVHTNYKLPEADAEQLEQMHIQVQYIPHSSPAGNNSTTAEFYNVMMEKFRILNLTQYERVTYLDADVLLRGSLDYIMELSVQGILQDNVVFAGRYVPASGTLFVLTPRDYDQMVPLMARNASSSSPNGAFVNRDDGWGHPIGVKDPYVLIGGKTGM
jgi:hypothetical protein